MSTTAILPVKRFDKAKRRLGQDIDGRRKRSLVRSMLGDVLDALGKSAEIDRVLVVTREPDVPKTDTEWIRVEEPDDVADHSGAAALGIERAIEAGAERVVLVPGDCPLLDPAELDAALRRAHTGRIGIVPDRHGTGTNALILDPPDAIEPSFGEGSRIRHEDLVRAEPVLTPVIERLYSMTLDIDTPSDLGALRQFLERDPSLAPRTAAVLQRMRRNR